MNTQRLAAAFASLVVTLSLFSAVDRLAELPHAAPLLAQAEAATAVR